jgi:hypothetical protein
MSPNGCSNPSSRIPEHAWNVIEHVETHLNLSFHTKSTLLGTSKAVTGLLAFTLAKLLLASAKQMLSGSTHRTSCTYSSPS